jgi:Flp pilus assembly protein TadG
MRIAFPRSVGWRRFRETATLFGRDRTAATAVEFGLISIPFLGLLFAIFQIALVFLMQQGLKAAVETAARQVLTGQAQNNTAITSWQSFRDKLICPNASGSNVLPSFITCANIVVDVRTYTQFSNLTGVNASQSFLTDGTGPQYNTGGPCDIVVVRAIYPMPVFLPTLTAIGLGSSVSQNRAGLTNYNGKWVQMLTAASVFRNEPYVPTGSTTQSTGCS